MLSHDPRTELQIAGHREAGEGEPIQVYNPATEEIIAEVASASAEQIRRATEGARAALESGELGDREERSKALDRLADILADHEQEILDVVVSEVGTPISTARSLNHRASISFLRWFAKAALIDRTEYLGRGDDGSQPNEVRIIHRPVGVVAGLTGYNYPVNSAAVKIGAAFTAGCPIVLLPSPQAPLSTLLLATYLEEAGFPDRAVSVVVGRPAIAQALITDPAVSKISFTGSVRTGSAVMKLAADRIRDVVLELGGKSAAIIMPGTDIAGIANSVHDRYLRNAGQGCGSPTRLLVHESQLLEFIEASRTVYQDIAVGDPWNPGTLVGPVISATHRDRVENYIEEALRDGGKVLAQADKPSHGPGWYVSPTLIGSLSNDRRINQEEVFGPVATVQSYHDLDDAIRIANDSTFGLHASIYGPTEEALSIANRFDVGSVTINGGGGGRRPEVSTGGWRQSGIGREKGEAGIREFLESVAIQWPI